MMQYEEKIKSLGLHLPDPPKPVASYVPLMRSGNLLFLSGMLPFIDGKLAYTGKLGDKLEIEEGKKAAEITLLNALSVIRSETGSLNTVEQFVRLSIYVSSSSDFTDQPAVANGASDLLEKIFGHLGKHARLALGAPVLPLDAPIELEMIVEVAAMGYNERDETVRTC